MTVWLISNPRAGANERGAKFWEPYLREVGLSSFVHRHFEDEDWAEQIQAGDHLLVAGGDGSVNRAARLCMTKNVVLGILPSGTANDFTRNLGIPRQPREAARLAVTGPTRRVDVGWANGHPYLNVCHVGLGTWSVRQATARSKKRLGKVAYVLNLLRRYWAYRGFTASIRSDHGMMRGRWLSIAVANGAFYGGGQPVPEASVDDGQLDIVAVRPRSTLRLLGTFLFVRLLRRSPKTHSNVVHLKGTWASIDTRKPKTVTADGELLTQTPLNIECRPRQLEVRCESVVHTRQ